MTTRTLLPRPKKPSLRRLCLREQAGALAPVFASPLEVDEEAGVIKRVKILGWESKNGRRYVPEAVAKAKQLYDGAKAFVDHPTKATDPRGCDAALGVWRNPVVESDGAYADLHYFKSHPLAGRVVEDARRGLGVFGASHNADGKGVEDKDGTFVVQEITEVRSVDLVTDAATVTNLWESRTMSTQTTLRAMIEASKAPAKTKQAWLTLLEDELADLPMDAPAEPLPSAEGDWKADLVAAIGKLVASEAVEDHDMAKKIMAMLKPADAAASTETATENEEEGYEKDKEDDEEKKEDKMEAKKPAAPPADILTLVEAKSLCKLAGLAEDAGLLGMLEGSSRTKGYALLEWAKGKTAPTKVTAVRSQGTMPPPKVLDDSKGIAEFLLGRN